MTRTGSTVRHRQRLHVCLFAIVLGVLLLTLRDSAVSQEVLTNVSIIEMIRVGLSEGVVIAKIQSSPAKFDVKIEDLVALKKAGVSDKIIETMVQRASGVTPSPPPMAPASGAPSRVPRGPAVSGQAMTVYHVVADKQVELVAALGEIQSSGAFLSSKRELVLSGRRASYRTNERQPVFLSSVSPAEAPLVRLKPGDSHDDRNLKVGSVSAAPYAGVSSRQGIRAEDRIDVESERDPNGFYRIKPRQPLVPGEYAFVLTVGVPGGAARSVFDFGVE